MDNAQLNAIESDAAHWQMRWDGGLGWICGPAPINPAGLLPNGALILRRWTGQPAERPDFPPAVGFALRPATQVSEASGVTAAADTHYYYAVDKVSGGGVVTIADVTQVRAAAFDSGNAWRGLLPNAPHGLAANQRADGSMDLTWCYNQVDQQAAPEGFDVFTDAGSGALDPTPIATVAYVEGESWYSYHVSGTAWSNWLWVVLARSAADVYSLTPLVGRAGFSQQYGTRGTGIAVQAQCSRDAPPTPTEVYG